MDNINNSRHSDKANQDGLALKFLQQLTSLDFVGKKAELHIGGKRRVKTFFGGLLSFLIFALIVIGFLYFGQEIVFKQIPSVVLSSIIDDGSKPILIDKENFNFLFTLRDSNSGNYLDLDSDFLDVKVRQVIWTKKNSKIGNEKANEPIAIQKVNLDLVDCDKVYFSSDYNIINTENVGGDVSESGSNYKNKTFVFESLVNNLNKKNYKCLAQKEQISGSAETTQLSYLEISVNSCLDFFEFLAEATGQEIKIVAEKVFKNQADILTVNKYDNNSNNSNSIKFNIEQLKKIFEIKSDFSTSSTSNFTEVLYTRKICPFTNLSGNTTEKSAAILNKNSPYSKTKTLFSNAFFVLKYIETYFDVRSFNKLADYVIEEYKTKLNQNQFKTADANLKQIEYFTDKGLILEDFEITSYTQLTKISERFENGFSAEATGKNHLDPLLSFRFNSDKIREVFFRKYYKAQNLIAELGGLLKSFFTVALILNYFNNHAKYYEKMIDDLFDVDDLYKYYQYYNSKNKTIFKKYRDSILLRNTKNMDNFKKNIEDKHAQTSNLFMKTRIYQSKDLLEGSLANLEILNKLSKNHHSRDNFNSQKNMYQINNHNNNFNMKNNQIFNENIADSKFINDAINNKRLKEFEAQNNYNSTYKNLKEEKEQIQTQLAPACIQINEDSSNINNLANLHKIQSKFYQSNLQNNNNNNIINNNNNEIKINYLLNTNNNNNDNINNLYTEQIQNNAKGELLNDYFFSQNQNKNQFENQNQNKNEKENQLINAKHSIENSFSSESSSNSEWNQAVIRLRKNERIKENFYKLKKKRFSLNMLEMIKFNCCWKSEKTTRKKQILSGGKSMINQKLDVIHILKKNLEFDRFKNLMLRDYQLVLLNSLSKLMLDPEKLNLVDFHNCNYDKFIDSYAEALSSESIINFNLVKLIDNKFQIDKI